MIQPINVYLNILFMLLFAYLTNPQVLWYLSGLTCTDENFPTKSGAQRAAYVHGIALISPDTSPRTLL